MIFANTLLALAAAVGVSAQRCRFGGCNGGGNTTPAPAPTTPAPPPPPRGATQSIWGQCGGVNWEYATACPTGAYCYNDGENEWYSQCIPEEDDRGGVPVLDNPNVETRILTTIFDVPGPTPTVVTTYITIFTQAPPPPPTSVPHVTITAVPDSPIGKRWSA
ncbi:uncharacterized protein DNG_08860 [Cephalotrichum gorgonifer]|uniref:CBM1 domain-containing protein n=1 Tax=Cephalotrichum gorgonifer TaxID=2041049 RepID=A0AAE8N4F7_9PEZI|nr:uncharacterized protein DNG_08860 [Cephalotrichum gorgonifer]